MVDRKTSKLKFLDAYASGENPKGFTAQTANGTAKSGNGQPGWNRQYNFERTEAEKTGPWSNGNRTGE